MTDIAHILRLAVPEHAQLVRQGLERGGLKQVEELHGELQRLQQFHVGELQKHRQALKHVERLIEDVHGALVEIRGTLAA